MRDFSYLNPTYIVHRLQDVLYRKQHPGEPWLTPKAIRFLESVLNPDCQGLEYGSGRSTTWFASRVKHLVSIEHNPDWYTIVSGKIQQLSLNNLDYHLHPKPSEELSLEELMVTSYVKAAESLVPDSLDFALVDGVVRPPCALRAIPLLKKGGWLILDDANHYLPSLSKAPNSRRTEDGALNDQWKVVEQALIGWDSTWFGNGIKETLVLRKPV
jgi:hypothetical protein